jgi:hypothetical protein
MRSIARMRWRVIILRTSARMVTEVRPNAVAVIPSSIRSPWRAELTKSISDMNFVTARGFPSWMMA